MASCSQEEADTRMFLHVADAIQSGFTGFRKVVVRTVDANVLVLAVALLDKLQMLTEGRCPPLGDICHSDESALPCSS